MLRRSFFRFVFHAAVAATLMAGVSDAFAQGSPAATASVTVNGKTIETLPAWADPAQDRAGLDDQPDALRVGLHRPHRAGFLNEAHPAMHLHAKAAQFDCVLGIPALDDGNHQTDKGLLPRTLGGIRDMAKLLAADACVWEGSGVTWEGLPMIPLGVKGLLYVELTCNTISHDAHSSYGTVLPNAAWRLVWAMNATPAEPQAWLTNKDTNGLGSH